MTQRFTTSLESVCDAPSICKEHSAKKTTSVVPLNMIPSYHHPINSDTMLVSLLRVFATLAVRLPSACLPRATVLSSRVLHPLAVLACTCYFPTTSGPSSHVLFSFLAPTLLVCATARASSLRPPPVSRQRHESRRLYATFFRSTSLHHRLHKRVGLARDDPDDLSAALEEPSRRCALVRSAVLLLTLRVQQPCIRELHEELRPHVRRYTHRINRALTISHLGDVSGLRSHKRSCFLLRAHDTLLHLLVKCSLQIFGSSWAREMRWCAVVNHRVRKRCADSIGERQHRRAIHDRVLARETCLRTIEHD